MTLFYKKSKIMKTISLTALIILFSIGCSKDPMEEDPGDIKKEGTTIEVSGSLTLVALPNSGGIDCAPDGSSARNYILNGTVTGIGQLVTDKSSNTITVCNYSASSGIYTGTSSSKWVFAPGDTLFLENFITGPVQIAAQTGKITGTYSGNDRVVGGTGKYKDAEGSLTNTGGKIDGLISSHTFIGKVIIF